MVDEMSITTAKQHKVATYNIELLFFEGVVLMSIFIPSSDQRRGGSGGVDAGGSDEDGSE